MTMTGQGLERPIVSRKFLPRVAKLMTLNLLAVLALDGGNAYAGGGPIGDVLCEVVGWFAGDVGAGIATLAVIIVGIGALLSKVSYGMALTVACGVAVMFGAPDVLIALGAPGEVMACAGGGGGGGGGFLGGGGGFTRGLLAGTGLGGNGALNSVLDGLETGNFRGTITGFGAMGTANMNIYDGTGSLTYSGAVPLTAVGQLAGMSSEQVSAMRTASRTVNQGVSVANNLANGNVNGALRGAGLGQVASTANTVNRQAGQVANVIDRVSGTNTAGGMLSSARDTVSDFFSDLF